ncbi:MAG: DUF177 domain-containing protein [Bacillota bacterium]|nr:DUF177 domain-containing protein [Bacillota bacterium]
MAFSFSVESLRLEKGSSMPLELEGTLDPIDLTRSEMKFPGPVRFEGQATNAGKHILVTGTAQAESVLTCDRCLEEYSMPLTVELLETFYRVDEAPAKEVLDDDARPYGLDDEIDLRESIEQGFLLQLPIKLLCSEECKGLCPQCGADRNKASCQCPPQDDWGLGLLLRDLKE